MSQDRNLINAADLNDKSWFPLIALQSAPGGGKSFFLDEFASFKDEDLNGFLQKNTRKEDAERIINELRNSISICITYNGNSLYDPRVDNIIGLVMRILWSYFFDGRSLHWNSFYRKFKSTFESLDIVTAIETIILHSGKSVFLCVDEIMKVKDHKKLLSSLYIPYIDKDKVFRFIVSTLDAIYLNTFHTSSGKDINWIPLRRLKISESLELFYEILNDKELDKHRIYLFMKCISDCSGHPRTLEKFYHLLYEDETSLHIDTYSSLISRLVDKITPWFSSISFSVIKTALLGNRMHLNNKINIFDKDISVSDLISMGVYINSLTGNNETINVVPTLTLISLQYFCTNNVEQGDAEIVVKILQDILLTEYYFDGKVMDGKHFEKFHCNWERLYRALREEGMEVSLREVYCLSDTVYAGNTAEDVRIMLQRKKIITLKRDVEFPPHDGKIYDKRGDLIKNFERYILVPGKTNNSGFDMTIFEKKVGGGHIAINVECKFSYPDCSTTLGNPEIRKKYDLMKEKYKYHVEQEKIQNVTRSQRNNFKVNSDTPIGEFGMTMEDIYLVIIAWRDINALDSDIKNNKNIIIVGKDSLEKAYTPTLVTRPQFYDNMLQDRDKISQEVMERVNKRYINYQSS